MTRVVPLERLALFRMGWSVAMLVLSAQESTRFLLHAPGQFHLPLLPLFVPPAQAWFGLLIQVASWAAIGALLGLLTRLSVLLVVLCHGYLFLSDTLLFRNHVYLALLMGGLLALSPCGRAWSLDARLTRRLRRTPPAPITSVTVPLLKLQVLVVYGWSVLNKLRASFLDGWTLQQELPYALRGGLFAAQLSPRLVDALESDLTMMVCAWLVVASELFLAVGLPSRRLRPYAITLGVLLHLTIFVSMGIFTFGCLMVSSYVLFDDARGDGQPLGS